MRIITYRNIRSATPKEIVANLALGAILATLGIVIYEVRMKRAEREFYKGIEMIANMPDE